MKTVIDAFEQVFERELEAMGFESTELALLIAANMANEALETEE